MPHSYAQSSVQKPDAVCDASPLFAQWSVSEKAHSKRREHSRHTEDTLVTMWRTDRQVAIHYAKNDVTELWEKTNNGRVKLVRYFEREKRGIEYMPNEIKGRNNWQDKWQLVSQAYIDNLEKKSERGEGCDLQEKYKSKKSTSKVTLTWLANRAIAEDYQLVTAETKIRWKMLSVSTDKAKVLKKMNELSNYRTTDYTDVGDNESDPFLAKMINMGFLDHGASGFYDANGKPMEAQHTH